MINYQISQSIESHTKNLYLPVITALVGKFVAEYHIATPTEIRLKNTIRTYHTFKLKQGISLAEVMRGRSTSSATACIAYHKLTFGRKALDYIYSHGFQEYKTLEYILPNPRPSNIWGIAWCIVHELAHLLTCECLERQKYDAHGYKFTLRYFELIKFFDLRQPYGMWVAII